MAVPDTNTFSLDDVVTEVNPTTDDLTDCFADATSASFDSTYSGNKDRLSNFRNYGASTLTAFSTTSTGGAKPIQACGASATTVRYHDGTGVYPVVGDTVWNTSGGTGNPSSGYYMYQYPPSSGGAKKWYRLSSAIGMTVNLIGNC